MHTDLGTSFYKAPEIETNITGYSGEKVDIFSLGVILFVMMAGYFPFNDTT